MEKTAKIYVAGHHGLVGSAIWNNLQQKGYTNLVGRSHKELDLLDGQAVKKFFDEEQPQYVILAAAHVRHHGEQSLPCRFYLSELADSAECDRRELPSQCKETLVFGKHLHLSS